MNDHGSLLPFDDCPYGTECPQFIQLLGANQSKDVNTKDRIHMHLSRHPSHHLVVNSKVYSMNTNQFFTYVDINTYESPSVTQFLARNRGENMWIRNATTRENVMLLLLIQEVIKNGYESELKLEKFNNKNVINSSTKTHFDAVLAKYQILDIINMICENTIKNISQMLLKDSINDRRKLNSTNWDDLMQELRKEYSLLDKMVNKMKHERHVERGSPLSKQEMFAIILYTLTQNVMAS